MRKRGFSWEHIERRCPSLEGRRATRADHRLRDVFLHARREGVSADYLLGLTDEKRPLMQEAASKADGDVLEVTPESLRAAEAIHKHLAEVFGPNHEGALSRVDGDLSIYRDAYDFHVDRDASPADAHERALEVMGWFLGRREEPTQ